MTCIRLATSHDREDIHDVHMLAFPEGENHVIAELAFSLLREETSPETITLVAEANGEVVGNIAFTPVTSEAENNWLGYNPAPLGARPPYQKGGIGKKLIERGIARLRESREYSFCLW